MSRRLATATSAKDDRFRPSSNSLIVDEVPACGTDPGSLPKKTAPSLLEIDNAARVVREHVTRVVIRRRERNATCSTAVLNVFGNCLESFIEQVGGKRSRERSAS